MKYLPALLRRMADWLDKGEVMGRRICRKCHCIIGKHHRYHYENGTVVHNNCKDPNGDGAKPEPPLLTQMRVKEK